MLEDEDVPSKHLVDIDSMEKDRDTEFDDELVSLKLRTKVTKPVSKGSERTKATEKPRKKDDGKSKRRDPTSTWGPGSHSKKAKVYKGVSKEDHVRMLERQKVLSGQEFETNAKGLPSMRGLVDFVTLRGWDYLLEWHVPSLHE